MLNFSLSKLAESIFQLFHSLKYFFWDGNSGLNTSNFTLVEILGHCLIASDFQSLRTLLKLLSVPLFCFMGYRKIFTTFCLYLFESKVHSSLFFFIISGCHLLVFPGLWYSIWNYFVEIYELIFLIFYTFSLSLVLILSILFAIGYHQPSCFLLLLIFTFLICT